MGIIEIEGMKFYAFHGHFEAEQIVGNHFIVDLQIRTNCSNAAESDLLSDAFDYQIACRIVQEEMQIKSRLLENVAGRILNRFYRECQTIEYLKVKISKLNPPMGGEIDKVSVTLER